MMSEGVEIEKEDLVIIYEEHSGRIVHGHHFVTVKGGQHPDESSRQKQAMEHARLAQAHLPDGLGVLHADPKALQPGRVYSVDPRKKILVEARAQAH